MSGFQGLGQGHLAGMGRGESTLSLPQGAPSDLTRGVTEYVVRAPANIRNAVTQVALALGFQVRGGAQ